MSSSELKITYVGGPTALLDIGGLRLLTDPTFDPAGGDYPSGPATLHKLAGPVVPAESLGAVDAVLLSHDHHFDNLDRSGREFLVKSTSVPTTSAGAERLGGNARGLEPWSSLELRAPDGSNLRVTATPARHGPANMDRGPVIGFVLTPAGSKRSVYVSGDTVWYEGLTEIGRRFEIAVAVLFMGAARVKEVGPFPLTMTAEDGVAATREFRQATIVPLHFEGWRHFSESRPQIDAAFSAAGLQSRLRWPEPGRAIALSL